MNEEYQTTVEIRRYEVVGAGMGRHIEIDIAKDDKLLYIRTGCDGVCVNSRIDVECFEYIMTVYNSRTALVEEEYDYDLAKCLNYELESALRTAAAWLFREERVYDVAVLDDNPTYKRLLVGLEAHCKPFLD